MRVRGARRWAVVAVGLALLCGLPVIASALPVSVPALTASQLRGRILASADESYAGYAESNATFGLPPLERPDRRDLTARRRDEDAGLAGGAEPVAGRRAVRRGRARHLPARGCRSYIWDSGDELLTEVRGRQPFRLPRPADLVPPALALRLLSEAGRQATFSVIAPRRVAGRARPACG